MDWSITTVCVSVDHTGQPGDFGRAQYDWFMAQLSPKLQSKVLCVSDISVPRRIPPHDLERYPGWWQKVTGAMLGLEDTLYIDLDTVVLNPNLIAINRVINEIKDEKTPIVMSDWLMPGRINSSIMWLPVEVQEEIREKIKHVNINDFVMGDQQFLETIPSIRNGWRWDELTEVIVPSWKQLQGRPVGKGKEIISFSGDPRPWVVENFTKDVIENRW